MRARIQKSVLYIIGFSVVIGTAFYFLNVKTTFAPGSDNSFKEKQHEIIEGGEGQKYSIEVIYPEIVSGIDQRVREKINKKIKEKIDEIILREKDMFAETASEYVSEQSLLIDFKSSLNTKIGVYNILFDLYHFTGGAHGTSWFDSMVFDVRNGEEIMLDDVFDNKTDYLKKISELSVKEIKSKDPNLETFIFALDGTIPNKENFDSFNLEKDEIAFYFDDYQVSPYSSGRFSFTIPYFDLKSIINKSGVLKNIND